MSINTYSVQPGIPHIDNSTEGVCASPRIGQCPLLTNGHSEDRVCAGQELIAGVHLHGCKCKFHSSINHALLMINLISFKSMILDVSSIIDLNEIYRVGFYWSTLKND